MSYDCETSEHYELNHFYIVSVLDGTSSNNFLCCDNIDENCSNHYFNPH